MGKSAWREMWGYVAEALSIGLAVVGSIVAGAAFGLLLDEKVFHGKTRPWFLIIGLALGAIGGFKNLLYYTRRMNRRLK